MDRCLGVALACAFITTPLFAADDGIPAKTLDELKAATVYVKVDAKEGAATGSGFLIRADGETGLVVTNHHVVRAIPGRFTPQKIALVFWSGTRKEQVVPAEVVAVDREADLAVLKVTAKDLPAPLDHGKELKLRETMTVYTLGFPLGDRLSPDKINPALTIGKATISSLREDQSGKLKNVQLDGELNPGNSGGPVVDSEGKLIGIAVSKIVGTRISFAIPSGQLNDLLRGRVASVFIRSVRVVEAGAAELDVEIPCVDPLHKLKAVELRLARKDAAKEPPQVDKDGLWPELPGSEKVVLTLEDGKARGKVTLKSSEKKAVNYVFQAVYDNGSGKAVLTKPQNQAINFGAVGVVQLADPNAGPPWEVVTSKEGGFTVDMPSKPTINTSKSQRTSGGVVNTLMLGCETDTGTYLALRIEFPTPIARGTEEQILDAQRDGMAKQWNGKVIGEKKVRAENRIGRDFTIRGKPVDEAGVLTVRVREYLAGKSIYMVAVVSEPEYDLPEDTGRFLGSLTLGDSQVRAAGRPEPEPTGKELGDWGLAIDQDKDCEFQPDGKSLTLKIPGKLHDLNPDSGILNSPRVVREVDGDFVVTVRVTGDFKPGGKSTNPKGVPYNGAGLIIWSDSDNFIRLERAAVLRNNNVGAYVTFEEREGGYRGATHNDSFAAGPCYLRIERKGSRIMGAVSADGNTWKKLKPIDTVWPAKLKVGLLAVNSSSEPFAVKFEEFNLQAPPPADAPKADAPKPDTTKPDITKLEKPPQGWSEYTPKDKSFSVWLPDNVGRKSERERTIAVRGRRFKVDIVQIDVKGGLTYTAENIILPLDFVRQIKPTERMDMFRDLFVDEAKGKVDEEKEIKLGTLTGKEYLVTTGQGKERLRLFLVGSRVLRVTVNGTKEQVESTEANVFLDSFRGPTAADKSPDDKAGSEVAKVIPGELFPFIETAVKEKRTKDVDIVGFKASKELYRDVPAEGGVLIGFEVGLGKFGTNDVVDSLRPIYLTKDGEKKGEWYGKVPDKPIEVKAKAGYVVGGLTVRAALVMDGFSVMFVKLDKNQLDLKDTYQSDWVGGPGGRQAAVGGKGDIFVGVTGHLNDKKSPVSIGLVTVLLPKP
jgi:regulation of enolase protein 1 (concanavalin A-like superfamily)